MGNHKKVIVVLASAVGVLIIAAGVFGAIYALDKTLNAPEQIVETNPDPNLQEQQTVADTSIDLGACTLVSRTDIATAAGDAVTNVADGMNRGFGHEASGDVSQTCVYPFNDGQNEDDRLTVTVTEFDSTENKSTAIDGFVDQTVVENLGERAYYVYTETEADDEGVTEATYSYSLYFFTELKLYYLTIIQPSTTNKFTQESARTTLTELASKI